MKARQRLLLGVDAGQSITKAALYDLDGTEVAVARYATEVDSPQPQWAERDMDTVWKHAHSAISDVVAQAGTGCEVVAVGICGHNDGLYAVDRHGRPVRPAILALDSRAHRESLRLSRGATGEAALALTGQKPSLVSPASLLSWLREHEPRSYERTRWALFCKDWIRLGLTGEVATDVTDASAAFTGLSTQQWSEPALELFGLTDAAAKLPPVLGSAQIAGTVHAQAAELTGLAEGTPVIAGAHDVDAAAIGIGAATAGATSLVLGTYSINHIDALREVFDFRGPVRVCGGGAPSAGWTQLLADVLDLPVEVTSSDEAGARGAAMLAGVGTGHFTDLDQVTERWVRVVRSQQPNASHALAKAARYRRYLAAVDALTRVS